MRQVPGFWFRLAGMLLLLSALAVPTAADSKDETLRPVGDDNTTADANESPEPAPTEDALRRELEEEYRAELRERLRQERESYEGSLTSLWLANAAVWTILIAFIIGQSLAARSRAGELARLKSLREDRK